MQMLEHLLSLFSHFTFDYGSLLQPLQVSHTILAIGGVRWQRYGEDPLPVAYVSRRLNKHEPKYLVQELEYLAIVTGPCTISQTKATDVIVLSRTSFLCGSLIKAMRGQA
jgi:hypothetical protein